MVSKYRRPPNTAPSSKHFDHPGKDGDHGQFTEFAKRSTARRKNVIAGWPRAKASFLANKPKKTEKHWET
jgi:hypothetical protein